MDDIEMPVENLLERLRLPQRDLHDIPIRRKRLHHLPVPHPCDRVSANHVAPPAIVASGSVLSPERGGFCAHQILNVRSNHPSRSTRCDAVALLHRAPPAPPVASNGGILP